MAPGLLNALPNRHDTLASAEDLFAYLAAILAHPGYTTRFADDLEQPGLRVPLTADPDLFDAAARLGQRVIWLHTYGERFADPSEDRPPGAPRLPAERRPKVRTAIPDTPEQMPIDLEYRPATQELHVGTGVIAPVSLAVWDYEVSGMRVLRKWFSYRKRDPEGRRSSPLDDVTAPWWESAWTTELLELINVLGLLVDIEAAQANLLRRILEGPLIGVADLEVTGVLPVDAATRAPPRVPATGGGDTLLDHL